jgi:hypothetical protein
MGGTTRPLPLVSLNLKAVVIISHLPKARNSKTLISRHCPLKSGFLTISGSVTVRTAVGADLGGKL